MPVQKHIINLDLPPAERWRFLADHTTEMNALFDCYLRDLSGASFFMDSLDEYRKLCVSSEYQEEVTYIASLTSYTPEEVLFANLYYDVLKFYLGCTAFAVEREGKIFHARNLDWHTENDLLSTHSAIYDFHKNGESVFITVGWYGFIGALSGMKPGAFSLTLNAVSSDDDPEVAMPVSFLLRDVLTHANTFDEAKETLENQVIASDCLLLLSGCDPHEMVVIERTPAKAATRNPEDQFIAVTNDYKILKNFGEGETTLQATSCSRYNRAGQCVMMNGDHSAETYLSILSDPEIIMGITVQQMVFDTATGELLFKLPE